MNAREDGAAFHEYHRFNRQFFIIWILLYIEIEQYDIGHTYRYASDNKKN